MLNITCFLLTSSSVLDQIKKSLVLKKFPCIFLIYDANRLSILRFFLFQIPLLGPLELEIFIDTVMGDYKPIRKRESEFFFRIILLKQDYCALINQIVIWLFCKQTQQCFANRHLPARQIHFYSLTAVHTWGQVQFLHFCAHTKQRAYVLQEMT